MLSRLLFSIQTWTVIFHAAAVFAAGSEESAVGGAKTFKEQLSQDERPLTGGGQVVLSYADVVEKVNDCVVTVLVTKPKPKESGESKDEENPFDLFRKNKGSEDPQEEEDERNKSGGSGVIFSSEGWVVTNAHVVKDAETIHIRLRGQEDSLPAILAGVDAATDIALLKVEKSGLKQAVLGNSAKVRPGDVVLAIGSPFGLEQTITLGIISATGRGTLGLIDGGMEDFIQTDAAINPGNSGGPLLDGLGRVIGINTARYWGDNIGFAVPVNLVLKVASDLHQHGWVVRGFLGVHTLEVTPRLLKELKLPAMTRGVIIKNVEADQAGAKAGFLPGDLIQEVNGRRVENGARFRLSLASLQPGDSATFKVLRDGQPVTLQATLGDPPELKKAAAKAGTEELKSVEWVPGLHVAEVTRGWRLKLKLSPQINGLIVTQDFKAADGSLRLTAGDQILLINGKGVKNLAAASLQLESLKASVLLLRIRSSGEERFVAVSR